MNPEEPLGSAPSKKGIRQRLLPSTLLGWVCLVVVGLAVGTLGWPAPSPPMSQLLRMKAIPAGLIGACIGLLAVGRYGERSWLVWIAGPGIVLVFLLGWILILTGASSFAGH